MSKSLTPRIKLTQESDDELIDPFAPNWPILDKYAGVLSVANGVTPPNSDLYDGCIVMEATSGISWIALSDGLGGFTKSYLTYPWLATATAGINVPSSVSATKFLLTAVDVNQSLNFAGLTAGEIAVPIAGIYEIKALGYWAYNAAASFRDLMFYIDSVAYTWQTEMVSDQSVAAVNTNTQCNYFKAMAAGTKVTCGGWQNSGVTLNLSCEVNVMLVSPL